MMNLLYVSLELFVSNRQGVEKLLQADCGALLTGLGRLLHQVALVVEHQLGPHLARLMACHNAQVTATQELDN